MNLQFPFPLVPECDFFIPYFSSISFSMSMSSTSLSLTLPLASGGMTSETNLDD